MKVLITAIALVTLSVPVNAAKVSWYGKHFQGRRTASGERFNKNDLTAASKTLRFGTRLRLTYRKHVVIVRVNDRGPYVRGRKLDISQHAAKLLHCNGVCDMKIEIVK